MPKAPKSKGKGKGKEAAHDDVSKPYTRTDDAPVRINTERSIPQPSVSHRNNHSPQPPKSIYQPGAEGSSSSRRRKNKKKRSRPIEEGSPAAFPAVHHANGHAEGAMEVNGAHREHSNSSSPNRVVEHVKPDHDAREAIRRRIFEHETNGVDHTQAELLHNHEREVKDLRKKVAKMAKTEEEAKKLADEARGLAGKLHDRIAELEQTIAMQRADMTKTKDEIEMKEKLIHAHGSRNDSLRELLHCGVCMEPLDDPHTLQCGHTACRTCLHEWFRSPNAYPAHDIEQINEDDDLSYRTKTCHMCRSPIFRRPARNILLSHVLESVGLATGTAGVQSASRSELDSMWSKIFPPEPKSWVVRDEADNVGRCPSCGFEVDYGECVQCGATFSMAGSEMSDLSAFDFQDRVDLGNGLLLDPHLAALNGEHGDGDLHERHHRLHDQLHDHMHLRGFLDDEAEDDEDSIAGEDEDDYNRHLFRTLDAAEGLPTDYDSEDTAFSDDVLDDDRNFIATDDDSNSNAMGHAMDSHDEFYYDHRSDLSPPRGWSPEEPLLHGRARSRVRATPPASPSVLTDASYESSFINDGDDVEYVSDDALDLHDESTNLLERSAVEGHVDEPSIEELRRRRAARYGAPFVSDGRHHSPSPRAHAVSTHRLSLSPSPPASRRMGRTRRRRRSPTLSSAHDSSVELLEEEPVRRPRIPRRQRIIDSDSE
ncbi:hypothetical protein CcaverHIS002_0306130 [Cutaneotrichosporon cavernicola]|uniref:RING-type domain-containing protein n=1 Tax=Cutaneotrichosporon cavernicola TaxID=279322 RepID=A0AA48I6E2_9TREE|nr:uncharacterized protein CcaverHIS019_0306090 [Cutaneotrichosporon cavernicola]BEI82745.1 hypothetical protein CcaverHIS002_0306130 [Cutaneotrichosporon cavernicola]BEI90539.1 hypothetical protein CcaverHIS019_0306090 [Cutaneotrichosporon cavernicola]BEI98313.1 hypothetical protein CcaverHIS631_0306120 [Cutaneotrichosporon cavernicola]BEJ06089.1 hypothetical protein CcaverHIS641_0306110 [Cutaneotrichosporon cavernicola]